MKGKLCWVVGLARSGCAAGALLRRHGARVVGLDDGSTETVHRRWEREGLSQLAPKAFDDLLTGGNWPDAAGKLRPDLIVLSPGVPGSHPQLAPLAADVPIIGELELGARYCQARTVAITGTNGKTTTTELTAHLGRVAGLDARALGNVGRPLCDVAEEMAPESLAVIEASSFQLETVRDFSPSVGVVLNLAPDHLDRYENLAGYYRAKRIMAEITPATGTFITSSDCPEALTWPVAGARRLFGDESGGADVFFRDGALVADGTPLMALADLAQQSPPNLLNALAATTIGMALGIDRDLLAKGLGSFAGLPDRHQLVAKRGEIKFINDTKATNVHAVCAGLSGYEGQVVLIAGGSGKGEDYSPLRGVLSAVKSVVLIGTEGAAIGQALAGTVPLVHADSMDEAVALAVDLAGSEADVLLSPACASFDMYANYGERGRAFAAAALKVGADPA